MHPGGEPDVTKLLAAARKGDSLAEARLLSYVYEDLRRIARRQVRSERAGQTLNATALVHEAYLRLDPQGTDFANRAHFFAIAAKVMRNILVEKARSRLSSKRGRGVSVVDFENTDFKVDTSPEQLLAINEALDKLKKLSVRQEKIVELRFFGGMSEGEMAEFLGLSIRTIRRDWQTAKAWLYGELKGGKEA